MAQIKKDTKSEILNATWKLLEENQGLGVRMSDIAKRAGVSRQAVYLHFPSRTDLMIATILFVDEKNGLKQRLNVIWQATSGDKMLDASVDVWGNYIPEIYGIAKAFFYTRDDDEAAANAWKSIISCLKETCRSIVNVLISEGSLSEHLNIDSAIEIYNMMISIQNWELLVLESNFTQEEYIRNIKFILRKSLLK